MTCCSRVFPPALCSTLAWRLFMRVPSPAARITIVTGLCIYYYYALLAAPAFLCQSHHDGGGGVGIVADLFGMAGEIARHDLQPHFHECLDIVLHRKGGLPGVPLLSAG